MLAGHVQLKMVIFVSLRAADRKWSRLNCRWRTGQYMWLLLEGFGFYQFQPVHFATVRVGTVTDNPCRLSGSHIGNCDGRASPPNSHAGCVNPHIYAHSLLGSQRFIL